MRINRIGKLALVAGFLGYFSACDKDENPIPKSAVRFEKTEEIFTESNGSLVSFHPFYFASSTGRQVEVKVVLDKPAAENAIIKYTLGGTASKGSTSFVGDYDIKDTPGTIAILKGETDGKIVLTLYEDIYFQSNGGRIENPDEDENGPYETVIITITEVDGPIAISEQDELTVKIYEDDTIIKLDWTATGADSVDMDLTVWFGGKIVAQAINPTISATESGEGVYIPAGFPDGEYSLGYTYAKGKSNDLPFSVAMSNYFGTLTFGGTIASELLFTGHYTLDNINTWNDANDPNYKGALKVVQTMTKTGFNYTLTDIEEVSGSSRQRTNSASSVKFNPLDGKQFDLELK
jgi:hypothetical protein